MEQTVSSPAQTGTFLEPERIVQNFGLEKGDHVADFGAGHGYFTIPIAKIVGGNGKVYALDVQKPVLDIIRARAKVDHLLNIETIWADLDQPQGSKLKDKLLNFVVIANFLCQVEGKPAIWREAARVLGQGGGVVVIDWDQTPTPLGPPLNLRVK
jgi:ubiquinone/menaquinone biosynthesis C-methylase UbiE